MLPKMLEQDRKQAGLVGETGGVAPRRGLSGVPGARDWHAIADFRDVGPDLQDVRLAADLGDATS